MVYSRYGPTVLEILLLRLLKAQSTFPVFSEVQLGPPNTTPPTLIQPFQVAPLNKFVYSALSRPEIEPQIIYPMVVIAQLAVSRWKPPKLNQPLHPAALHAPPLN